MRLLLDHFGLFGRRCHDHFLIKILHAVVVVPTMITYWQPRDRMVTETCHPGDTEYAWKLTEYAWKLA